MLLIGSILSLLILISMLRLLWQGVRIQRSATPPPPPPPDHCTTQVAVLDHAITQVAALVPLVTRHQVPIVWDQTQQIRLQPLPTTTNDQLTGLCRDLAGICPSPTGVVIDVTDLPRSVRLPVAQHLITQLQIYGYQSLTVHGLDAIILPTPHSTTYTRN